MTFNKGKVLQKGTAGGLFCWCPSRRYNLRKRSIWRGGKESGCSISTVSGVINGKGKISKATIERLMKIAQKHNYVLNQIARSLKNSKTNTIGIIVTDIRNYFYMFIKAADSIFLMPDILYFLQTQMRIRKKKLARIKAGEEIGQGEQIKDIVQKIILSPEILMGESSRLVRSKVCMVE